MLLADEPRGLLDACAIRVKGGQAMHQAHVYLSGLLALLGRTHALILGVNHVNMNLKASGARRPM